ncbi:MAG: response regulator [bacterium]|nr:response regulator [bacterium]
MSNNKKTLILIIDDNSQNLRVLGNILRENGYGLVVAKSGPQGLKFLHREKPELILLDIMMPQIDGYQVCETIKSDPLTKHIPVIFLTARTDTQSIVKGFDVGAVDYVTKPFQAAELLARVKTHIDLKRTREEVKQLKEILPICCMCKKVRDDEGFWHQVEVYFKRHAKTDFSHGYCPDCFKKTMAAIDEMD